jgi:membrane associated rhomboid family serine protease
MGIYDRDYYRKEGPSYLDRLIPSGAVCKWLIIINFAIFLGQVVLRANGLEWVEDKLTLSTPLVLQGEVWRVLTYAFLHFDFLHILFNMLFLWWFGSDLEGEYGSAEFLAFYLGAAVAGAGGYMLHGAMSPSVFASHCLGASGAVTGTMLLCAIHFPNRTILMMMMVPVPIWFFVVFSVVKDVIGLYDDRTRVAVAGHLGGAAFAGLYYHFGWRLTGFWRGFQNWRRQRSRPRLRIYKPSGDKEPVTVGARPDADEHLEAKVDAVLEKVMRSGQQSLTEQERQLLLRASEIYKKRRT